MRFLRVEERLEESCQRKRLRRHVDRPTHPLWVSSTTLRTDGASLFGLVSSEMSMSMSLPAGGAETPSVAWTEARALFGEEDQTGIGQP